MQKVLVNRPFFERELALLVALQGESIWKGLGLDLGLGGDSYRIGSRKWVLLPVTSKDIGYRTRL